MVSQLQKDIDESVIELNETDYEDENDVPMLEPFRSKNLDIYAVSKLLRSEMMDLSVRIKSISSDDTFMSMTEDEIIAEYPKICIIL